MCACERWHTASATLALMYALRPADPDPEGAEVRLPLACALITAAVTAAKFGGMPGVEHTSWPIAKMVTLVIAAAGMTDVVM